MRQAVRGLLRALAEEEERRAAVEGSLELTAKEAECAWRVELLTLYRETAARVQRLSAAQAARYQALEESLESSAAEQGPEAVAQLELLTNLAVETRSQVQREVEGVGTANPNPNPNPNPNQVQREVEGVGTANPTLTLP